MDWEECKIILKNFTIYYTVGGKDNDCYCNEFKGCNKKSIQ